MAKLTLAIKTGIEIIDGTETTISVVVTSSPIDDKTAEGNTYVQSAGAPYYITKKLSDLNAITGALQRIEDKSYNIEILTDNLEIITCMKQKWYKNWEYSKWRTSRDTPVEHSEYWIRLLAEVRKFPKVTFVKPNNKHTAFTTAKEVYNQTLEG